MLPLKMLGYVICLLDLVAYHINSQSCFLSLLVIFSIIQKSSVMLY